MFDDAVEMSIRQAKILATLSSDVTAAYFNLKLEINPFFDLDRVHKKEAEDDYIRTTPEIQRICDAIVTFFGQSCKNGITKNMPINYL